MKISCHYLLFQDFLKNIKTSLDFSAQNVIKDNKQRIAERYFRRFHLLNQV